MTAESVRAQLDLPRLAAPGPGAVDGRASTHRSATARGAAVDGSSA
ncbi:hypothetical protein [Saccharopolyspora rhizosphaerae]|nr:hypothetical protein [Saccharopolyspora rhizosphaerae]